MIIGGSGINSGPGIGSSYDVKEIGYSMDDYDRYTISAGYRFYGSGFMLQKTLDDATYDMDIALLKHVENNYHMSVSFLNPRISYGMSFSAILPVESRVPKDSIINTLIWSWATVLDQSYRNARNSASSMTLPNANSAELDLIGEIYHTKRFYNESDQHYRKRLTIQTSVSIGCGTKHNSETIIDSAIGVAGCNIITGPPATVRITFDNDAAMRAAKANRTLLQNVIPNMLATGISWDLYTPISDYLVDTIVLGSANCPYTANIMNQTTHEKQYIMSMLDVFMGLKTIDFDILLSKYFDTSYDADMLTEKANEKTYLLKEYVSKAIDKSISANMFTLLRNNTKSFVSDILLQKYGYSEYAMDTLTSRTRTCEYDQYLFTIKRLTTSAAFDILIANLIAEYQMDYTTMITRKASYRARCKIKVSHNKTFVTDLMTTKTETKNHTMDMKVVAAP